MGVGGGGKTDGERRREDCDGGEREDCNGEGFTDIEVERGGGGGEKSAMERKGQKTVMDRLREVESPEKEWIDRRKEPLAFGCGSD